MLTPLRWFLAAALLFVVSCASGEASDDGSYGREGTLFDSGSREQTTPDVWPDPPDIRAGKNEVAPPPPPDLTQGDVAPSVDLRPPDLIAPDTGPSVLTAPFSMDFETTNGGISGTKDWEWGQIAFAQGPNCDSTPTPPTVGHSGKGMWGTKLNDCYSPLANADTSCNNQDTTDDSILTLTFKIPSTFKTANLAYWEWTDYFLSFDWAEVYVNGKVTSQHCSGSSNPKWVQRVINLDTSIGQMVTVELHFMATAVVQRAGWYIDDISVSESLPP